MAKKTGAESGKKAARSVRREKEAAKIGPAGKGDPQAAFRGKGSHVFLPEGGKKPFRRAEGQGDQQQEIRSPPIISQQQSAQIRLAQQFISVPHPPI